MALTEDTSCEPGLDFQVHVALKGTGNQNKTVMDIAGYAPCQWRGLKLHLSLWGRRKGRQNLEKRDVCTKTKVRLNKVTCHMTELKLTHCPTLEGRLARGIRGQWRLVQFASEHSALWAARRKRNCNVRITSLFARNQTPFGLNSESAPCHSWAARRGGV